MKADSQSACGETLGFLQNAVATFWGHAWGQ